ncbi:MAG: hypothetical protein HRU15_06325, partial [Planctomycetes bacterium]|nr:hypothetical protein [Planctomycetota bacterium]
YGFEIDSVLKKSSFVFGDDSGQAQTENADKTLQLIQPGHSSWTLQGTDKSGKRIAGWAGLRSSANGDGALIAVRNAWQQWPIRFNADKNGTLGVDLYGGDKETFLDLRYHAKGDNPGKFKEDDPRFYKSKSMFTGLRFSKGYGQAEMRAMGITKTHDLVLDFTVNNDFAAVGNAQHKNVILYPGGKRFSETRALGLTGYYHDQEPRMKKTQQYFETMLDYPLVAHEVNGYYGWVDYPDAPDLNPPKNGRFDEHIFAGGRGWTNAERMIPGYMMYYIASGSQKNFDLGHQLVYHSIGFDIEHAGGDAKTGGPHRHNQVHWGADGGPRQAGWRGWYYHYWLTGNPEVWRCIEELHPTPMAISDYSGIAKWPYQRSTSSDRWYPKQTWDKAYLFTDCDSTPFHMMNLLRFQTTGDIEYVRYMELLMHVWGENIYFSKGGKETSVNLHLDLTKAPETGVISDVSIASPHKADFKMAPQQKDEVVTPRVKGYYHSTYGGCEIMAEWAQLSGSSRAIKALLLFGDYYAENEKARIDLHASKESKNLMQLYKSFEALAPAYMLLRQKTHPERVKRWRDAMLYRTFHWRWGSPDKFKVDNILDDPLQYTAASWHKTGINVYGQNGFKIWSGTAMSSIYTLWFVQEP